MGWGMGLVDGWMDGWMDWVDGEFYKCYHCRGVLSSGNREVFSGDDFSLYKWFLPLFSMLYSQTSFSICNRTGPCP